MPLDRPRPAGDGSMPDSRRLAELRELALLLAADVVERQLQEYLDAHGVAARWGAQERILVCLTPRSNAGDMLRSGQRNALRFHGALLAAYVEQPGLNRRGPANACSPTSPWRANWAPKCTACKSDDFVEAILDFAREQRVTQLFLGHTMARSAVSAGAQPHRSADRRAPKVSTSGCFPHVEAQ